MDGFTVQSGRVEFCVNGSQGFVCDREWNDVDANIVCRELGLGEPGCKKYIHNSAIFVATCDCMHADVPEVKQS